MVRHASAPGGGAPPTVTQKVGAAGYYMGASIATQYATKALFTSLGFTYPVIVALLQMAVIAPITYLVSRPALSWKTAQTVMPLALVNVANMVFGLIGTSGLNVPMFIVLRRFTLVFTIIFERMILNRTHDVQTYGSVGLMVGGALIAAMGDLTFNPIGYAAVFANNITTAAYLVLVKRGGGAGLGTTGLLAYNSALTLPLLAVGVALSGEFPAALTYPRLNEYGFVTTLAASALLGVTINHSTFVCTRVNEPLLTSTAGSFKNVLMTVIGAFAFGDFVYSTTNTAGIVISMMGAVWYAWHSATKSQRERRVYDAHKHVENVDPTRDDEEMVILKETTDGPASDSCHPRRA